MGSVPIVLVLALCVASHATGQPVVGTDTAPAERSSHAAVAKPPSTLREAAAQRGIHVGVSVRARMGRFQPLKDDPRYGRTIAAQFNHLTTENALKWSFVQPEPGRWNFDAADEIVSFAERHGLTINGHALIYHSSAPAWVRALGPDELRAAAKKYVHKVMRRYRGRITSWDVVNEAIDDGGGLRKTLFLEALGEDYVAEAFRMAHEADPDARLLYGDYGTESQGKKQRDLVRLVRDLKKAGVPIHGVALQAHLLAHRPPSRAGLAKYVKSLTDLGLDVVFTEMDVRTTGLTGGKAYRLAVQRRVYHDTIAACLPFERFRGVTFWGLADSYSWIDQVFGPDDPLLFGDDYEKKPAWHGVFRALTSADQQPTTLRQVAVPLKLRVGVAVKSKVGQYVPLVRDARYGPTIAAEFNEMTVEDALSWSLVEPEHGHYDFGTADAMVALAERYGMRVNGHALIWHGSVPGWARDLPPDEFRAAAGRYVTTVVRRYRGRIAAWDVVKGALDDKGHLLETRFLEKLGANYIAEAFRVAHAADPDASLFYSESGAESPGAKQRGLIELVRDLKQAGVPLHGVGLQAHLQAHCPPSKTSVADCVRALSNLGVDVVLSEMDVRIRDLPGDLPSRLEVQRRIYADIIAACLPIERFRGVTFWGVTDGYSWIDQHFGPDDPLLFSEDYVRKPAWHGVFKVFEAASRRLDAVSGPDEPTRGQSEDRRRR